MSVGQSHPKPVPCYYEYVNKNINGFTIVELLIVIVVIAILAAVSVAGYNGITTRATNASVQSSVNALEKGLKAYLQDKGEPLQVSDTLGSSYGVGMQYAAYVFDQGAACVGDWGSVTTPDPGSCVEYMGNSNITAGQLLEAYKITLDGSGLKNLFPKISSAPVGVQEGAGAHTFIHKAPRYTFTEGSRRMFIYYAQVGKNTCMRGDLSIRPSHVTDHPNRSYNDSWDRGGDYTSNNSTMCQRTINY